MSRVASTRTIPGKKAKCTAKGLKALVEGNPGTRVLLSDNGWEFDELLKEKGQALLDVSEVPQDEHAFPLGRLPPMAFWPMVSATCE